MIDPNRESTCCRIHKRSRERPLWGIINTVYRGFDGGGSSVVTRKIHICALKTLHLVEKRVRSIPPISFTDEDFKTSDPDQDDSMVISIELADYGIGNVLVD